MMIHPGSLPLYDGGSRNELTYHLPAGWDLPRLGVDSGMIHDRLMNFLKAV